MDSYNKKSLSTLLPVPKPDANKYSRGKLILFAGSSSYPGAAILAATAGQRTGAGYTEVFSAPTSVPVVQAACPSLVVRSWKGVSNTTLASSTFERPCAYVIGPGFNATKKGTAATLSHFVLDQADAPVLVDGGALSFLASTKGHAVSKARFLKGRTTVITPHAGEAQRLAKIFDLAIDDPAHLAYSLSLAYGVMVVLKGPETFVSNGEEIFSITHGTSALAKAGTGDVLSGMIGALLAQGLSGLDASVLGATLHIEAGLLAAAIYTSVSVTAEDVINHIPAAIRNIISSETNL